jgi:ribonuclease G
MVSEMKNYLEVIAPERKTLSSFMILIFHFSNITMLKNSLNRASENMLTFQVPKELILLLNIPEALHVVDVNSGNNITTGTAVNKEHALKVNKMALQKSQDSFVSAIWEESS